MLPLFLHSVYNHLSCRLQLYFIFLQVNYSTYQKAYWHESSTHSSKSMEHMIISSNIMEHNKKPFLQQHETKKL